MALVSLFTTEYKCLQAACSVLHIFKYSANQVKSFCCQQIVGNNLLVMKRQASEQV